VGAQPVELAVVALPEPRERPLEEELALEQ
jgi:hypothetical protein